MSRIITPDDVVITITAPTVRINADENASEELNRFIQSTWGTGNFESYIDSILSLFQRSDGTYGITEVVTFIISRQFRESFVSVHASLSTEDLSQFIGLENKDGVLEMGKLTENMLADVSVTNRL